MHVKAKEYYGQTVTVVLLFEQAAKDNSFNSFLYEMLIGTGSIGAMEVGEQKEIRGQPNLQGLVGSQEEFLMYKGHSLED